MSGMPNELAECPPNGDAPERQARARDADTRLAFKSGIFHAGSIPPVAATPPFFSTVPTSL